MSAQPPLGETNEPSRTAAWLGRSWMAAVLYLALTLVMTFPLVLHFASAVPHGAVDLWQNYWNFWWWEKSLLDLHQHPYWTEYLFHPSGASMVFYTHSTVNMLVSLPVTALFGSAAAYNFCVVLGLWLSGFTMYLLVRELTGEARGAFLAGLVFAFFPQHVEQTLEHLNLFSTQFMPLAVLFLVRLGRAGGWFNIAGLAVAYALNALTDWHLGILLSLTLVPIAIVLLVRRARPAAHFSRDVGIAAAIAIVLMLPGVWPLIDGLASGEEYFRKGSEDKGIDLLFAFVPSDHHPIWGALTFDFYESRRAYRAAGFLSYLGYVPLGLLIFALLRRTKGGVLWTCIFLGGLVLALGARPYWGGELYENVTLPFAWVSKLPVISLMRVANRWLIIASLGLAVMAGLGWSALRRPADWKFYLLAAAILLEYLWLPYPIQRIELSPYYDRIANSGTKGAILDIPFTPNGRSVLNMVAQTRHGRPIAGGYLSTLPPKALKAIQEDSELSQLEGLNPKLERPIDWEHLIGLGFEHVIMHKDRSPEGARKLREELEPKDLFRLKALDHHVPIPQEDWDAIRASLEQAAGAPVHEDEAIIVYRIGNGQ